MAAAPAVAMKPRLAAPLSLDEPAPVASLTGPVCGWPPRTLRVNTISSGSTTVTSPSAAPATTSTTASRRSEAQRPAGLEHAHEHPEGDAGQRDAAGGQRPARLTGQAHLVEAPGTLGGLRRQARRALLWHPQCRLPRGVRPAQRARVHTAAW